MVLLENEQFLSELTKFYERAKTSGTVLTSMKRYDGRTKPHPKPRRDKKGAAAVEPHPPEPSEYKCLIRASMGSRKIRTVISAKDMNKFQQAYALLLRAYVELKKKEKTTTTTTNPGTSTTSAKSGKRKSSSSSKATKSSESKKPTSASSSRHSKATQ